MKNAGFMEEVISKITKLPIQKVREICSTQEAAADLNTQVGG